MKLTESQQLREYMKLVEGYEQRVEQAAKMVAPQLSDTNKDVGKILSGHGDKFAEMRANPESKMRKDFIKDVIQYLKTNRMIPRKKPKRVFMVVEPAVSYKDPIELSKEDVIKIGQKLIDFAGNVFPDGDPHDSANWYFRQIGIDPMHAYDKLVPEALYLVTGQRYADYSEYLADFWDDIKRDHGSDSMLNIGDRNPWRSY